MCFILGAIIGAGVIGAAGSAIAGSEQASGQEQAAATQAGMFNTINSQEQPFIKAGQGASASLSELLGTSPTTGANGTAGGTGLPGGYLTQQFNPTQSQLEQYPGYQFQLNTGAQSVENASAPGSGAMSGAALKGLMSFNQGTAASNYQNYFNQFQTQQNNIFNRLSGIASLGQNAAGNLGNNGAQLGTGIAQAQAGAAASTAGGIVGATNSLSGGINTGVGLNYLLANNNNTNLTGGGTDTAYTPNYNLSAGLTPTSLQPGG